MKYKQVSTSSCRTNYLVEFDGKEYEVQLWIITGGTPALEFSDYKGPTKRFPRVEKWNTPFDRDKRCYSFQDPNSIQGPTLDVLPSGDAGLSNWLLEAIPQREARLREEAVKKSLIERGIMSPRQSWETRKPEAEPRQIANATPLDGGWQVKGREIVKALKKAKGSVEFLGCVIGITRLRQYFRVLSKDILIIRQGENSLTVEQGNHKTTFLHGAWDKYGGENGYHARLTFGEV